MRTKARIASTFAAVAASALLMTGCGGGSEDDGGDSGREPEPSAVTDSPGAPDTPAGGEVDLDALQGSWMTVGEQASVSPAFMGVVEESITVSAKSACTGTIDADARPMTMKLTCEGDATQFSAGTVKGMADGRLTIEWANGEEHTYGRPEELDVPGLPTDVPSELPSDFPSGMPTELPDLPGTES